MNCDKTMEIIYESSEAPLPLYTRLRAALHLFLCSACTREYGRYEMSRNILSNDFFPPSPEIEDSIMALIAAEEALSQQNSEMQSAPGELSTRGWVIAGFIVLVSLVSTFFGFEFNKIALAAGMSYLLPVGITIGIVLTSYGALFIGSHLKELSERFGL